ncbi:phosphatidate cytidylyltransferase [Zoogloea sp.]|uniref:phosphatidate cytidylyltransferase n=1 Tax=Zoogloea sp. TaxID=49181 RepID=UPI00260E553F|nr:phosphatidate cytidylyltransferase [Zoogloea sp.]MDD3354396.1 phosphatidate cytidylyltransferase [Zoogloea sp.]
MLKARVITALFLLAGLMSALFLLPPPGWLALASLICAVGASEWAAMVGFSKAAGRLYGILLGGLCAAGGMVSGLHLESTVAPFSLAPLYGISALFWLGCVPFWLKSRWKLPGSAAGALVGLVLLLPPSLALAHLRLLSPWLLLAVMAAVWVADVAAYFTGRAFGRRKLAPHISPGKSWEGAYGAAAGVLIYGLLCLSQVDGLTPLLAALAVPVLLGFTAVSIIGDLFESLIKRQAGVKDSGTLLPGHGGVLDRIDSLTSTLPLAGLAFLWIAR